MDECCRHHIRRQQVAGLRTHAARGKLRRTAVIRYQALVARLVLARQHNHLHAERLCQACLDLAWLDAEAANLDLEVVASQVVDAAVGAPAAQVAGLVHAFRATEGIVDKALGSQVGTVQVTARHLHAGDMELASYTDRDRCHVLVENVDAGVLTGGAYATPVAGSARFNLRYADGRFGRSIGVQQAWSGVGGQPECERMLADRLPANNHPTHAGRRARAGLHQLCPKPGW
ncbi:hypothetical protein D3C87_1131970 [compost metagenome]